MAGDECVYEWDGSAWLIVEGDGERCEEPDPLEPQQQVGTKETVQCDEPCDPPESQTGKGGGYKS